MQNNNTQPSIREQLKHHALNTAIKQKDKKESIASWILPTSWCIGGVVSIIIKSAIASNMDRGTSPSEAFALMILGSIVGLFVVLCSYHLLLALCSVAVSAKKGAGTIVKATSQELDTITSAVAKKVTKAIESGKNEAKIKNEKEILRQKVTDLELQQLKKRISDLEKQLKENE